MRRSVSRALKPNAVGRTRHQTPRDRSRRTRVHCGTIDGEVRTTKTPRPKSDFGSASARFCERLARLNQNARSLKHVHASVSAIQSRAQPCYAGIEPGRKILTRASPITIFAELTDKLTETRGNFWLFAKQAPQTFPYLSANGLIVLCVNIQFTHDVCTPMARPAELFSTVWQLAFGFGPALHSKRDGPRLGAIGLDRVRQKNASAHQRHDGHH